MAARASVSRTSVGRVERGLAETMTLRTFLEIAAVLEIRLGLTARWRGGELDRLLSAGHSAMHEVVARRFGRLPEWIAQPEVSFSIYGERGVIDVLAFHPLSRALLVIELKTEIVDVQALLSSVDRYTRLARRIAADRGWRPSTVSSWVIVRDTMTNRRRVVAHATVLRAAFPNGGRSVRAWLRAPSSTVRGLSFMSDARDRHLGGSIAGVRRVRPPQTSRNQAPRPAQAESRELAASLRFRGRPSEANSAH